MAYHHENIRTTRLPNGVLVLTETMPDVESVAFGVWADAGSVDEPAGEYGLAHFLEHMLFKGTETRSALQLAEEIEDVGGQLNAFTERETTHLFARTLAEHLPVAVTLLADMVCHSVFAPQELDRERQVIIEEIRKYESLPEERIQDLIMEGLWYGGGLGHPILGSVESIQQLTREHLVLGWQRHFAAERVLVTAAGKFDHDHLVDMVASAFADLPAPHGPLPTSPHGDRMPRLLVEEDDELVHCCWGGRTFAAADERNFALALIDATLGGSTTSRLFQEIREKRGLAYDIASFALGFRDTGFLCGTASTSADTFPIVLELMQRELQELRRQGLSARELARAKEQMKAGMALGLESTTERMRRLATHQLTWGKVYPLTVLIDRVSSQSAEDVQRVLDEVLDLDRWAFAAIGPIDPAQIMGIIGTGDASAEQA